MMSTRPTDDFDRLMAGWMEAEGRVREPDELIDRVLERTRSAHRRPRWLVPEWWMSMQNIARLQAVWRPAPLLFLVAALALAAALILVIVGGSQRRLPSPFGPAANGTLVFDTNEAILAAKLDGTAARALVTDVPNAAAPAFSPDGQHFVFWGDGSPDTMYVANADGSQVRKLVEGLWVATNSAPTWSPDSRRVAVSTESGPDRADEHLAVIDVETGAVTTIPQAAIGGLRAVLPAWSPDGQWIAVEAIDATTTPGAYWIVRPDGTDGRRLTTSRLATHAIAAHWAPAVSPLRIAYGANGVDNPDEPFIAMLDVMSGVETRISSPANEPAFSAAWSPDATRLAWFRSVPASELVIAPVADPMKAVVVARNTIDGPIAWSPDGQHIYGLTSDLSTLVVVTLDGSTAAVRVPHNPSAGPPDWQRLAP